MLSLREYFAARFLYDNAGEDSDTFDSTDVLRELRRRPYSLAGTCTPTIVDELFTGVSGKGKGDWDEI